MPTRPSSLLLDLLVLSHVLDMLLLFAFGYEFAVGYVFVIGFGSEFAIGQFAVNPFVKNLSNRIKLFNLKTNLLNLF